MFQICGAQNEVAYGNYKMSKLKKTVKRSSLKKPKNKVLFNFSWTNEGLNLFGLWEFVTVLCWYTVL